MPLAIIRWLCLLAVPAIGAAVHGAPDSETFPPTIEELVQAQPLAIARFSPNGNYLAVLHPNQHDTHGLTIFSLASKKTSAYPGDVHFDLEDVRWLTNDQLLLNVGRDNPGVTNLYVADRIGLDSLYQVQIGEVFSTVGLSRIRSNRALVWRKPAAGKEESGGSLVEVTAGLGVATVDVISAVTILKDGTITHVDSREGDYITHSFPLPKPGAIAGWMPDFNDELGLGFTVDASGLHLHHYLSVQGRWEAVPLDLAEYTVLQMDPDGHNIWVVHQDSDAGSVLQRYDCATGKFADPIYHDKNFDLGAARLIFSRKERRLAGLSYYRHRLENVWFLPVYAGVQGAVDRNSPEWDNRLVDCDEQERHFVFLSSGPRQPGAYQVVDLEKKSDDYIIAAAPALQGRLLVDPQIVNLRTRDGATMEGFLTLPPGATKENPPPLVVLAHGGPWSRDLWTFNPEVQFLASRGYAVLQPNFRGSTGFSAVNSRADRFNFRRMHDDVTDATRAVQKSGLVDPDRIGIMGAGFGGDLALAGAALEPALYHCAISNGGIFDWDELTKNRGEENPPESSRAGFDEISSLAHAAEIHLPVLIAHSADDRGISAQQARAVASALEKQGAAPQTFFRGLGPPGTYTTADRVDYYRQVESFLGKSLMGMDVTLAPRTKGGPGLQN